MLIINDLAVDINDNLAVDGSILIEQRGLAVGDFTHDILLFIRIPDELIVARQSAILLVLNLENRLDNVLKLGLNDVSHGAVISSLEVAGLVFGEGNLELDVHFGGICAFQFHIAEGVAENGVEVALQSVKGISIQGQGQSVVIAHNIVLL